MNKYKIEHAIFSRIAKVKRCGSCFRCQEADKYHGGWWNISVKPPKGVKVHCCSACSPECTGMDMRACEWWEPRWYWNMHQRWSRTRYHLGRVWIENVRMRIGALRKPVPLIWVDGLNAAGEIAPLSDPKCPHCGEMPYSTTQCQFCGQRFINATED